MDRTFGAFARLRVLNEAAGTGFLALAVIATATPTHTALIPSAAAKAVAAPLWDLEDPFSVPAAPGISEAVARLEIKSDRRRTLSTVEGLPAAGVMVAFWITQPDDGRLSPQRLVRGADSPTTLATSTFTKPPAVAAAAPTALAMARLPQAKPEVDWPIAAGASSAATPLLAYAPADRSLEAPFEALMGDSRLGTVERASTPRPRPNPDEVLTWLDGRALGQFAPGQHAWVTNPLPASVHHAKQQKCLAEGIYFESRSESESGQAAVAQVILNRVRNPAYPDTICEVVYQNKNMRNRCQFSFACDGIKDRVRSKGAWRIAQRIASDVTAGKIWLEDVGDSTHYYAYYVRPGWASRMIKADRIGAHLFYRTRFGGWS